MHQCNFTFITVDVEGPILGIDFLRKFHMTVDPTAACVHRSGGTTFPGILSLSLNNPVLAALPAEIQPVITTFSDVCSTKKSMLPPAVDVQHFLLLADRGPSRHFQVPVSGLRQVTLCQGDIRSLGP